jgi:hypothetical protein
VIAWFAAALDARYSAYSYGLDHLLVETPHSGAIGVDAKLSALETYVEAAQDDQYCVASAVGAQSSGAASISSRYTRPVVPKAGS